jgi:hypothetical protein
MKWIDEGHCWTNQESNQPHYGEEVYVGDGTGIDGDFGVKVVLYLFKEKWLHGQLKRVKFFFSVLRHENIKTLILIIIHVSLITCLYINSTTSFAISRYYNCSCIYCCFQVY